MNLQQTDKPHGIKQFVGHVPIKQVISKWDYSTPSNQTRPQIDYVNQNIAGNNQQILKRKTSTKNIEKLFLPNDQTYGLPNKQDNFNIQQLLQYEFKKRDKIKPLPPMIDIPYDIKKGAFFSQKIQKGPIQRNKSNQQINWQDVLKLSQYC